MARRATRSPFHAQSITLVAGHRRSLIGRHRSEQFGVEDGDNDALEKLGYLREKNNEGTVQPVYYLLVSLPLN